MPMTDHDLIPTTEVMRILGVSRRHALRLLVPAQRLPGRTGAALFARSDVERLAERRRTSAGALHER